MFEEGRARNSRPDVVTNRFSRLTHLYRDLRVDSPRQIHYTDETHIQARISAMSGCTGTLGDVGMLKPEVLLPPFASVRARLPRRSVFWQLELWRRTSWWWRARYKDRPSSPRRSRKAARLARRFPAFFLTGRLCAGGTHHFLQKRV